MRPKTAIRMQALRTPHARKYLQHYQQNVMGQRKMLAAEQAMQDRINHLRAVSYATNPRL